MKKFKSLLLLLTSAILLSLAVGCEKEPQPNPPTPPDPEPPVTTVFDFEVSLGEIDFSSVTYSIVPSVSDAGYLHLVVNYAPIENLDSLEVAQAVLAVFEEEAADKGKTLEEYLPEYLTVGNVTNYKNTSLDYNSDYALVVFGVDLAAEEVVNSAVKVIPFSTEDIQRIDCTFEVSVVPGETDAILTVTPSDENVTYHLMHVPQLYFEQYTNPSDPNAFTIPEFYEAYLEQVYIPGLQQSGMTLAEIYEAIFVSGENEFSATGLVPNTGYQYLVAAISMIDENYFVVSDVTTGNYTTLEPTHNGMTFDISVTNITANSATISLVPSDNSATFCWLIGQYDGESTAEEMMNDIVAEYAMFMNMGMMLSTGPQYHENYSINMFPNTEYSIIAFGYSGGVTSDPTLVTFKTLPPEHDPAECEFDVTVLPETPYYFDVEIIPTDKTVYYSPNICLPGEFDAEKIAKDFEDRLEEMLFAYNNDPQMIGSYVMSDIVYYTCYDDDRIVSAQGLDPETTYTFYICVVEPTTGKVLKVVDYPSLATTPALGSINVEPEIFGYYSGDDEKGEIFGDRAATAGKAIAVVKFNVDPAATGLFSTYVREDDTYSFTDTELNPDSYLYGMYKGDGNLQNNIIGSPYSFYVVGWREKWVSLSFATDQNGVYGDMARLLMQANAQNKGDIQELKDLVNSLEPDASQVSIPYRPMESVESTPYIPFSYNEISNNRISGQKASVTTSDVESLYENCYPELHKKLIVF